MVLSWSEFSVSLISLPHFSVSVFSLPKSSFALGLFAAGLLVFGLFAPSLFALLSILDISASGFFDLSHLATELFTLIILVLCFFCYNQKTIYIFFLSISWKIFGSTFCTRYFLSWKFSSNTFGSIIYLIKSLNNYRVCVKAVHSIITCRQKLRPVLYKVNSERSAISKIVNMAYLFKIVSIYKLFLYIYIQCTNFSW